MDLYGRLGKPIHKHQRSPAVEREMAQIRDQLAVVKNTVRATSLDDGRTVIAFTIESDDIGGEPANAILGREPVALVYAANGVGLKGPKVYSDREDFPRDLTHLNTVPVDAPVSICLAREGHAAVYEREGVCGIVGRLCRWLLDAKAGTLDRREWEPVPVGDARYLGILHGAAFQDFAIREAVGPAWAICPASLTDGAVLPLHDRLEVGGPGAGDRLRRQIEELERRFRGPRGIPAVFVWQGPDRQEAKPGFGSCARGGDLLQTLDSFGLRGAFDQATAELAASGGWRPTALLLLIGIRRPYPMMDEIFGLSNDREARSLELRGYIVRPDEVGGGLDSASCEVAEVLLDHLPIPVLFADVSGAAPLKPVFLVGYGALGSELGAIVTRMGAHSAGVLDANRVRSHNLARHAAIVAEIGWPKAQVHQRVLACLNPIEGVNVRAEQIDVVDLPVERLAEMVPADALVLDSTASDSARRVLARCRAIPRIARSEIYGSGRLGVQSIESADRNPDVLDLYYEFCALSFADDSVAAVLRADADVRDGRAGFAAGFGCASATVRMPQWKVSAHAAAFMPAISRLIEGDYQPAGIGLNPLQGSGEPIGWRWIGVDAFRIEANVKSWEVRIGVGVEARMSELMKAAALNETGGYLYGGFDPPLRRITVVFAAAPPPGTVCRPSHLELPPAGRSDEERRIRRDSGRRLVPVGSWHSHPGGGARMSERDVRTADRFRNENLGRGLPTLLLVIAPDGLGVHLLP